MLKNRASNSRSTPTLCSHPSFVMSSDPANTLPPDFDDALPRDYDPAFTAHISTRMRVPDVIGVRGEEKGFNRHSNSHIEALGSNALTAHMNVPEKLIYEGNNESRGMRKDPELHLDLDMERQAQRYIGLHTPPRHLTLDETFKDELIRLQKQQEQEEEEESQTAANHWSHDTSRDNALPNGYTPSPLHTSDSPVGREPLHVTTPLPGLEVATPQKTYDPATPPPSAVLTPGGTQYLVGSHMMRHDDEMLLLRRQIDKLSRHVMRLEQENHTRTQREWVLYPAAGLFFLYKLLQFFVSK